MPETITGFDGNHNYNDFIDNLDYLMIRRGDFDKFNLSRKNSYPPGFIEEVVFKKLSFSSFGNVITIKTEHGSIVGNNEFLEKGYYKEFTIKNQGFKDENYFYHKTSTGLKKINENILKIKAFNKTLIAGNNYLQLLHGEKEILK
ncbi:hypothetical protein [Spiroplasma endosymbiont of 'Nebria riversi']|uniref:hypothetical protein n=1 Tax=Spiroplasma endosymbiont of 'Nebria riversi' TaxID=2792084 RepID=UPI001C04B662|nr:hypothetical protein [Spiroplasma endosymbiont of 'Nebria riversi']